MKPKNRQKLRRKKTTAWPKKKDRCNVIATHASEVGEKRKDSKRYGVVWASTKASIALSNPWLRGDVNGDAASLSLLEMSVFSFFFFCIFIPNSLLCLFQKNSVIFYFPLLFLLSCQWLIKWWGIWIMLMLVNLEEILIFLCEVCW